MVGELASTLGPCRRLLGHSLLCFFAFLLRPFKLRLQLSDQSFCIFALLLFISALLLQFRHPRSKLALLGCCSSFCFPLGRIALVSCFFHRLPLLFNDLFCLEQLVLGAFARDPTPERVADALGCVLLDDRQSLIEQSTQVRRHHLGSGEVHFSMVLLDILLDCSIAPSRCLHRLRDLSV